MVGANSTKEMIRVANDGRTVEFPDRRERTTFPVEKVEEYGDVALVWMKKSERWRWLLALPIEVSSFCRHHPWYAEYYQETRGGPVIMSAEILNGTDIQPQSDDFTALKVGVGGQTYHFKSVPYSLIEDPLRRGFLVKYSHEKDDARNLYMYGSDGALRWQLGVNPWNEKFRPKEVFFEDETGKLFIQWDSLHLLDGYEVDVATGEIIASMRFFSRNPLQYTVLEAR